MAWITPDTTLERAGTLLGHEAILPVDFRILLSPLTLSYHIQRLMGEVGELAHIQLASLLEELTQTNLEAREAITIATTSQEMSIVFGLAQSSAAVPIARDLEANQRQANEYSLNVNEKTENLITQILESLKQARAIVEASLVAKQAELEAEQIVLEDVNQTSRSDMEGFKTIVGTVISRKSLRLRKEIRNIMSLRRQFANLEGILRGQNSAVLTAQQEARVAPIDLITSSPFAAEN